MSRFASIDVVRGAAMVLMALDHVRDYFTNLRFAPENLAKGTAALFATRWVTHFCAPAFFLLAGLGAGIAEMRGMQLRDLRRFLAIRGAWLIVLDLTVTAIGWQFGFKLIPAVAIVLWTLGWSMIALALLVRVPRPVLAVMALLLIAGHNLLDRVPPTAFGALAPLWHFLHVPGFAVPGKLIIAYPLIPWVAVMMLGYVIAPVYGWEPERRRRLLIAGGICALAAFVLLRAFNSYGNPVPWSEQRSFALTVSSFLNVRKYPPSLQFVLMTVGPILVALALAERWRGLLAQWFEVFGRVPMFFYVVHIFVAHALAVLLAAVQGGKLRTIPIVHDYASVPEWYGVPLPGVYLAWAIVVVLMYFPSRWFAELKSRRDDWWLRYL